MEEEQPHVHFRWAGLLVALGMIAVVVAIIFPLFARTRSKALQESCLSNVKQFGLSFAMYATDYDNKLPLYDNGSAPGFITDFLGQATKGNSPLLSPAHPSNLEKASGMAYLKNLCIMMCPSDPGRPTLPPTREHLHHGLSYSWNQLFANYPQDKIAEPRAKIMLIDQCSVGDFTFVKPTVNAADVYDGAWSTLAEPANFVHSHGLNCLYLDGHAKWLNKQLWPPGGPIAPGNKQSAFTTKGKPEGG